jgi:isopentenyldiphosphate isomerase
MASTSPTFSYVPTLQDYAVNDKVYLERHPKYDVLCTGVVVFDKDGKLLIVQRAADEKAFPNMWVSSSDIPDVSTSKLSMPTRNMILITHRRYQEARSTTLTRRCCMRRYESSKRRLD